MKLGDQFFVKECDMGSEIVKIQRKRARIAVHDELRTRRCKSLRKRETKLRHRFEQPKAHACHDRRYLDITDDETQFPY